MIKKGKFRKAHLILSAIFTVAIMSATTIACENTTMNKNVKKTGDLIIEEKNKTENKTTSNEKEKDNTKSDVTVEKNTNKNSNGYKNEKKDNADSSINKENKETEKIAKNTETVKSDLSKKSEKPESVAKPKEEEINKNKEIKKVSDNQETNTNKSNKEIKTTLSEEKYVYDNTNNYYESLNGLSGKELRASLRKLQAEKAKTPTTDYDKMPDFFNKVFIDKFYDNDNTIIDMYSEKEGKDDRTTSEYKTKAKGDKEGAGLHREYIVRFIKDKRFKSDFHIVWPADAFVKNDRTKKRYDFGEVIKIHKTFSNGTKSGTNTNNKKVFEPIDMFKGDVARALLYFSVTYAEGLSNDLRPYTFSDSDPYFADNNLETYLKWNKLDAVDEYNIHLNNEIAKENKNLRNPFVDYPNLSDSLFGENPKPFINKGILKSIKK